MSKKSVPAGKKARSRSRRDFLAASIAGTAGVLLQPRFASAQPSDAAGSGTKAEASAVVIDSRRELFVDRALIEEFTGAAEQRLHHPIPREVALEHYEPWEGTGCGYHSVFRDGDLYRMYYKAWHIEVSGGKVATNRHPLFCCYAESKDGIHWVKPNLGLHEFQGSTKNNIVMTSGVQGALKVDAGHPAVFKDENPEAPADARYKAILRSEGLAGLLPFKSPDGIHWSPMAAEAKPLFHGLGAFDSQNLAFWDPTIKKYRAYWRIFTEGVTTEKEWKPGGYRAIRTATSDDFLNWGPHTDLTYEDSPSEQLYTNQIKPYHRAPHLLLGFPTRYIERGWTDSMKKLPDLKDREGRNAGHPRYAMALTECLVMASRNGTHFTRWNEAFMRPGVERPGTWHYGHQYIGWHLVETKSALPGAPDELSLYAVESYWHGKGSVLRRHTLRLDGFVSVSAPRKGGELTTKPVVFKGKALHLNFATSAAGRVRVELQTPDGKAIPGYALADCHEIFGDTVDRVVAWKKGSDVSTLAGKPIRLHFELSDADLYSYRFEG